MNKQKSWTILDLIMKKLYKSTEPNLVDIELGNLLNNYNIPKLDNDTANGLEHDILENEVFTVLKKNEK